MRAPVLVGMVRRAAVPSMSTTAATASRGGRRGLLRRRRCRCRCRCRRRLQRVTSGSLPPPWPRAEHHHHRQHRRRRRRRPRRRRSLHTAVVRRTRLLLIILFDAIFGEKGRLETDRPPFPVSPNLNARKIRMINLRGFLRAQGKRYIFI